MTLAGVISIVDDIKPNAFSNASKTEWINEVEGLVQTEVMLLDISSVITYDYTTDSGTELLVPPPHTKIYWSYIAAMIDFANGEYDKYQNSVEMFNRNYVEYTRWYAEHINPLIGEAEIQGYYISAYSIAVKHGYVGTEEEWLETLKGEGPPAGIIEAEIPVSGWVNKRYTLHDAALIADDRIYLVAPASGSALVYARAKVIAADVTVSGQMEFSCTEVPTDDVTVRIVRIEVQNG